MDRTADPRPVFEFTCEMGRRRVLLGEPGSHRTTAFRFAPSALDACSRVGTMIVAFLAATSLVWLVGT
jgi:hypothetical protein